MTSNNLEVVELIIEVQSRLLSGATWGLIKPLDKALKLLQADEVSPSDELESERLTKRELGQS